LSCPFAANVDIAVVRVSNKAKNGYGLRGKLPARPVLAPHIRYLFIDSHV
jgi:hypothetical protein